MTNWGHGFSVSNPIDVSGCPQDEMLHSGADVEALQAALNRDIGGDASTSQPSGSDAGINQFDSLYSNFQISPSICYKISFLSFFFC